MIQDVLNTVLTYLKRMPRTVVWVAATVLVALLTSVGAAVFLTSTPAFFSQYHGLAGSTDSLQTSVHSGLPCGDCHMGRRGPAAYELALVGDFYRSLLVRQGDPAFTKMEKPTNDSCLRCHRGDWSIESSRTAKVPHPAHLQVSTETRPCVDCHKWTAHEEPYMEKHKAMPFSSVCASFPCHVGVKTRDACPTCHHTLQEANGKWKQTHPQVVQAVGANACLESCHTADQCRMCHTTGKTPVFKGLAVQVGLQSIVAQHSNEASWVQQHGTFALQDQSKCFQCHVSDGECRACHAKRPAFHGPPDDHTWWIGNHKTVATDKRRCLECHQEQFCTDCHKQFKEKS